MYKSDVTIIGGGLGGLMSGALLAKRGYSVVLLERHYVPGGCATNFKRRDFVMEVGLHSMDGLDDIDPKTAAFDFLDVKKHVDFVPIPEFFRLYSPETDCTIPADLEATYELLSRKFPEDRKALRKFLDMIVKLREEVMSLPVEKWKFNLMLPVFPLRYPNIVFHGEKTVGNYLDAHFSNEQLKAVLLANLPYYHDDPHTMSMMFFAIAQASFLKGGVHYIRGGSQKLSDYLASVIVQNGGRVLLGKTATDILVENGVTTGVRYRDVFNPESSPVEIASKDVIVNAALPLVPDMLPAKEGAELAKSIEGMEPSCSLFSLYMCFNCDLGELGSTAHSTMIGGKQSRSLAELKDILLDDDYAVRGAAFVDYSRIDSGLAPDGKSFASMCTLSHADEWKDLSDDEYAAKKEAVAQALFKRMEQLVPGALKALEYYEVSTPRTINRYTSNPMGSAYGFAQTPSQAGLKRPARVSKVKGLRFASAWAAPGGGQSGAMIGGIMSADELQRTRRGRILSEPVLPGDERLVRLVECTQLADTTFEMAFEKPPNFVPVPGQYAVMRFEPTADFAIDTTVRPLTIASHHSDELVRFTMRESTSPFKQHCLSMRPGDQATLFGPTGDFVLPATGQMHRNIAFIVAGVGITPAVPMVQELANADFPVPTTLLYADKSPERMAYRERFEKIDHPHFNFKPVYSALEGRINISVLTSIFADPGNTDFYLVGTSEFLADITTALLTMGVCASHIRKDDFG